MTDLAFADVTPTNSARPSPSSLFALGALLVVGVVVALCQPARAATQSWNVLVLYGNGRLLPADIEVDRGIREAMPTTPERHIVVYEEFLDAPDFTGPDYFSTLSAYLLKKYASRPPDVFIAAGDSALRFLLDQRGGLFSQAPIVHVGISPWVLRAMGAKPPDVVGVAFNFDFAGTIDLALRMQPEVNRVVIVTGASPFDREVENQLRAVVTHGRTTAEFLSGLPTREVLSRVQKLDRDAVVMTPGYFQDGSGQRYAPRDSAAMIAEASAVPVYGPFSTFIGTGVVGGSIATFEAAGQQAGRIATALLDGAAPRSLSLPAITPTVPTVDWRQIQRWGIDEARVPANAVVHFRQPTFLAQHWASVIAATTVFVFQAALIAWLLVERRRRQLAELAGHHHRLELAHASRLAMAGELTAAIAHEINQPLGAILSNADAADLLIESGADHRHLLQNILADIRRDDVRASEVIRRLRTLLDKHEVDKRPFDLGEAVSEVELLLRAEAMRRRVLLTVRPAAMPITMVGDRTQIQQVVLNLGLNAMDAVADVPDERRTVVVSVERGASAIDIAVQDRGHGISTEHMSKLFDSFFSTKVTGMGMGLSIARALVEAHGGRIWAENGPGDGALFHVQLPGTSATTAQTLSEA